MLKNDIFNSNSLKILPMSMKSMAYERTNGGLQKHVLEFLKFASKSFNECFLNLNHVINFDILH